MIGKTIGRYQIQDKLGEGGMGEVYLADDTRLGRKVALKVLPEEFASNPERLQRLEREARSAAALNNPNICTIYEIDDAGDQTFISMEYIEGDSLKESIPVEGYPTEQAVQISAHIATGVAHAHSKGIIHRDLKSSNVMIDTDGQTKILDFGLAKPIERDDVQHLTQPEMTMTEVGTAVGTLPYMAPEILRGEPADKRSDVWSIGVLLYEIVTGRLPFQGTTGYDLSSAIIKDVPPPFPGSVPGVLADVIKRCLEKNPSLRYQDASEVSGDISNLQRSPISLTSLITSLPRLIVRSRVATAGVILAALTGIVLILGPAVSSESIPIAVFNFTNSTSDSSQDNFIESLHSRLGDVLLNIPQFEPVDPSYLLLLVQGGWTIDRIVEHKNLEYYITGDVRDYSGITEYIVRLNNKDNVQEMSGSFPGEIEDIDTLLKSMALS
ncbi:serine/threonine protein kinase, partial [Gemmatimonadota bacterium]